MDERADMALVRDYVMHGSEESFAFLVSRHVDLVYSAALRQVRDAHLAQEITQAVFLVLVRKAPGLGPDTILAAWLYRTAQFAAADALKTQRRRLKYEQEAAQMNLATDPSSSPEFSWDQIAPLLDEAVGDLGEKDRAAVLLRFFEQKSLRDVGAALGASEDSAQKRIARALIKLRDFFARRGVVLSAGVLTSLLTTHAVQAAPAGVAALITAGAAPSATISIATSTLVKGTLHMILLKQIQTAGAIAAALLLAAGTVTVLAQKSTPPPAPATAPVPAVAAPSADRGTPLGALRYLAEALAAYDGAKVADSYLAEQPGERRFIQAMAGVVAAEGQFKRNVDAKFGEKPLAEVLASRGAPLISFYFGQDGLDSAKQLINGDKATITLPDSRDPGQDHRIDLRQTGRIWKIYAGEANEQSAKKAAMFEAIAQMLLDTAAQVEAGKFNTFADVMRAIRKGMMTTGRPR